MKKAIALLLLAALLCGCAQTGAADTQPTQLPTQPTTLPVETAPPETVPPDGNPDDVTCKGSYTGQRDGNPVVARVGERVLTRDYLQVWYWAAVAAHRDSGAEVQPDYSRPLDTQSCPLDTSVNTWQQYFLNQALNNWHTVITLIRQSETVPMPTEDAYQPNWKYHNAVLPGMPAVRFLYGHNVYYQVNTLHQAWLDSIPQFLTELAAAQSCSSTEELAQANFGTTAHYLDAFVRDLNRAYMYFTEMAYYIEPTQEELDAYYAGNPLDTTETAVNIRHCLLVPQDIIQEPSKKRGSRSTEPTEPIVLEDVQIAEDGTVTCSETAWDLCREEAEKWLAYWQEGTAGDADFAAFANEYSADTGTANNGGAYLGLRQGQLMAELDGWCFDPARRSGDTTMIRTPYGIHLLYFTGWVEVSREQSRSDYIREKQLVLLEAARESCPMEVDYTAITLGQGSAALTPSDLLYPDIAHQRYPEIPLYLQQDYPTTMYGNYPIRSHGCGITTMAMLASYMADDQLTPPEMCARFGNYCYSTGTDGKLFSETPASMGFYLREKTYDPRIVWAALEEGQIVISCQHTGYWTRGGHYIALERCTPDKQVQVRDSNIYNYATLRAHRNDLHKWYDIVRDSAAYWIFQDKVVTIGVCSRCGDPESLSPTLVQTDYTCEKCAVALLRRTSFLTWNLETQ